MYKFAPACDGEAIAFGSARPGYTDEKVAQWLNFMQMQNIQRVCCLLPESQLVPYHSNLIETYQQTFGSDRVCWSPIEDFQLSDLATLTEKILPFLRQADQQNEKALVHCGGGVGRTGHVLAAWLVHARGMTNETAIAAALKGRNPLKVVKNLEDLLNQCRPAI